MQKNTQEATIGELDGITLLHKGIWGRLVNGQELPVGGHILSNELTIKVLLDFDAFEGVSLGVMQDAYEENEIKFGEWFNLLPEGLRNAIDKKIYFQLIALQNGVKRRLALPEESTPELLKKRDEKYHSSKNPPRLSEFRDGTAFCAERAALGQYLLQQVGIPSVYMSGLTYFEDPETAANHSWIVLFPNTENALIWDIARPTNNLPSIYKNKNGGIALEMFQGKDNAYIDTLKLQQGTTRYFGVSDNPRVSDGIVPHVIGAVKSIIS